MPYAERDIAIYYTERGPRDTAQAVLFCHGAGGNAASWWRQIGAFADRYRCVAFDHRGFARSRCAGRQFSVAEFGADALAVLDAAGIEQAHFVCQSMGGWTGVQVALRHPERVRSLVLSDTLGGIAQRSGIDSVRGMGERAAAAGAVSPALAADYHRRDPAAAFLYQELSAMNADLDQGELFRQLFAAEHLVDPSAAAALDLPILVVGGGNDLIWAPVVLRELAATLRGAEFVEIDAGHSPYFENAPAFNAALERFLEGS